MTHFRRVCPFVQGRLFKPKAAWKLHLAEHLSTASFARCTSFKFTMAQSQKSNLTKLEKALLTILDSFYKYSEGDSDNKTLSNSEAKDLINAELPHILGKNNDEASVRDIMTDLDKDGKMNLREFTLMLMSLAVACDEESQGI
ncbi:protein S100-A12-like [Erpetoichthys calabaricus]|uniref:protein S100-A12-like n=1 Tax=Erpetoichthys calabaricus TaxID=27687 RepID=UPI0010A00A43|nr:protein S100-A12-like [Erpetoichthys calabaricus]